MDINETTHSLANRLAVLQNAILEEDLNAAEKELDKAISLFNLLRRQIYELTTRSKDDIIIS